MNEIGGTFQLFQIHGALCDREEQLELAGGFGDNQFQRKHTRNLVLFGY